VDQRYGEAQEEEEDSESGCGDVRSSHGRPPYVQQVPARQ
jgi:hypothetical protein